MLPSQLGKQSLTKFPDMANLEHVSPRLTAIYIDNQMLAINFHKYDVVSNLALGLPCVVSPQGGVGGWAGWR